MLASILTQSRNNLRYYLNKKHALSGSACTPQIHTVKLQGWFSDPRAQYWIVTVAEGGPGAAHQTSSSSGGDSSGGSDDARRQLEGQEQERLARLGQDCLGQSADPQPSETTLWLQYTQWPAQFAGRPLDILAASAVQPRTRLGRDYVLGREDEDFVSPIEDELKLRQLVALLDRVRIGCLSRRCGSWSGRGVARGREGLFAADGVGVAAMVALGA
jgi:hypothetical protein